jgi:hypothetical protein
LHVEDLIQVERELGYHYEMSGTIEHYQWICPPCRRALLALAQARLWQPSRGWLTQQQILSVPAATPSYVNPAVGEGPLGEEDKNNFHP